jgi:succinate-semialdehyde dehydrogenase/glutarate-semialdehyde dehydrogenase
MNYQSINPYDGKILKTFEQLTNEQLETKLRTAATCFENWRQTTFVERAAVVAKAAAIMRSRSEEFARPVTLEMGKLIAEARGEVALSADIIDYYAKNAERFPRIRTTQAKFRRSRDCKHSTRRALRRPALEFSLLPARTLCRAQSDGG